jgi:hypothetical protein
MATMTLQKSAPAQGRFPNLQTYALFHPFGEKNHGLHKTVISNSAVWKVWTALWEHGGYEDLKAVQQ